MRGAKKETLPVKEVLVDGDYMCYRAFYAMNRNKGMGVNGRSWKATGMVYGFIRDVMLIREMFQNPTMVVCFDDRHNFRKELCPSYKVRVKTDEEKRELQTMFAQRETIMEEYLPAIGFANVMRCYGMEADDLIALRSRIVNRDRGMAVMASADVDLYQSITSRCALWNVQKELLITKEMLVQLYGNVNWLEVKAIAGCPSDTVVGVAGVAETTAIKFLTNTLGAGKKYEAIMDFINSDKYLLNRMLVRLPFDAGKYGNKAMGAYCEVAESRMEDVQPDRITHRSWREFTERYEMPSLRRFAV